MILFSFENAKIKIRHIFLFKIRKTKYLLKGNNRENLMFVKKNY